MRFRQLLEYDRQATINNFGSKIIQKLDDEEPEFVAVAEDDEEVIGMFMHTVEAADPTPNKKYVMWLVRQFLKKGADTAFLQGRNGSDVTDMLRRWDSTPSSTKKQLDIPTDINRLDWRGLAQVADQLADPSPEHSKSAEDLGYKYARQMNVLYTGGLGKLIVPQSHQAACELGKGTSWCTSKTSTAVWYNLYVRIGTLYIWIPETNQPERKVSKKFQFFFGNTASAKDEHRTSRDRAISEDLMQYFREEHPVVKRIFGREQAQRNQ
mgnify:CR=1 FL=1